MQKPQKKGFTLIELLTVIAIIGVLAAILIPSIGKAMEIARKASSSNNARQIATSYMTFATGGTQQKSIGWRGSGGIRMNQANTVTDWAAVLAIRTDLNDAGMWFITSDDALAGVPLPTNIVERTTDINPRVNTDFRNTGPKSWSVVAGMPPSAPATQTPIIWTRGLKMGDPMWEIESPWRGTGGHIAFLDGHVAWYGSLDPTVNDGMSLSAYPTRQDASGAVMDISLALPSETVIRILDPDTDD